jgi:hypothetical protein
MKLVFISHGAAGDSALGWRVPPESFSRTVEEPYNRSFQLSSIKIGKRFFYYFLSGNQRESRNFCITVIAMSHITTVRIPDEILAAMARLQARDGIPTSEQIRRALSDWLKKKGVYTPKKEKR